MNSSSFPCNCYNQFTIPSPTSSKCFSCFCNRIRSSLFSTMYNRIFSFSDCSFEGCSRSITDNDVPSAGIGEASCVAERSRASFNSTNNTYNTPQHSANRFDSSFVVSNCWCKDSRSSIIYSLFPHRTPTASNRPFNTPTSSRNRLTSFTALSSTADCCKVSICCCKVSCYS